MCLDVRMGRRGGGPSKRKEKDAPSANGAKGERKQKKLDEQSAAIGRTHDDKCNRVETRQRHDQRHSHSRVQGEGSSIREVNERHTEANDSATHAHACLSTCCLITALSISIAHASPHLALRGVGVAPYSHHVNTTLIGCRPGDACSRSLTRLVRSRTPRPSPAVSCDSRSRRVLWLARHGHPPQ